METRKSPSVLRIIWVDYLAFVGVVLLASPWLIILLFRLVNKQSPPLIGMIPVIIFSPIIIGLLIVPWRILLIRSTFNHGLEISAVVNDVWFIRDRGRVEYTYTFQGEVYASGNALHKSRYTRFLEPQLNVTVLVDRNNPKRAFIQELYA